MTTSTLPSFEDALERFRQQSVDFLLKEKELKLAYLTVVGDENILIGIQMPDPDEISRRNLFARAGIEFAHAHPNGPIRQLFFASEAWGVERKKGETIPRGHLDREPDRVEVLIVAAYDGVKRQFHTVCYKMLRDGAGNLIDLKLSFRQLIAKDDDTSLSAFVQGYELALAHPMKRKARK